MFGAHDSRLVPAWHLRFKRRATVHRRLGPGNAAYTNALCGSTALRAKAPSQPRRYRHADSLIDKADDHGIDELLPAQVIPVVSVVGLEQVLAKLHRWPRRAIDLLAGRDCCEVDTPAAHAEVAS